MSQLDATVENRHDDAIPGDTGAISAVRPRNGTNRDSALFHEG
jgi:hypothetical protein